jgi:DNA repair exonuclease SbcCD ATPase subunit
MIMTQLEELQQSYADLQQDRLEPLKKKLHELAMHLQQHEEAKAQLEKLLSDVKDRIRDKQLEIYQIWGPYIVGAEKASLDCNGILLKSEPKINVKVENRDESIQWLQSNGYEGVLKYDLHTQTLYAIAREKFKEGFVVPGLEVKTYHNITVKNKGE